MFSCDGVTSFLNTVTNSGGRKCFGISAHIVHDSNLRRFQIEGQPEGLQLNLEPRELDL